MPLHIDADFDGGNIEVRSLGEADAHLTIRQDSNGPWFQWFYFKVAGAADKTLTLRIVNAGASAYPGGWPGYQALRLRRQRHLDTDPDHLRRRSADHHLSGAHRYRVVRLLCPL